MNSEFERIMRRDICSAFLNLNEFGDVHTIDGKEMRVIIDANELIERAAKSGTTHSDGLYRSHILIYIPVEDYGPKPKLGKLLNLDGKRTYQITEVIDEDGIYSMELEANRV